MSHRIVFIVAASISMLACEGNVTSLGRSESAPLVQAAPPLSDDERCVDGGTIPLASSYSWMPVADSTHANRYLLPTDAQTNVHPGYHPATWYLGGATVDIVECSGPPCSRVIGAYKASATACGTDDGWYYADGEQGTATAYRLCPASEARVTSVESFRLSVTFWDGTTTVPCSAEMKPTSTLAR